MFAAGNLSNGVRILSTQVETYNTVYINSSRHSQHESMAKFHIVDRDISLKKADEAKAIGHDDEAIVAYLLGGDHTNVSFLRRD